MPLSTIGNLTLYQYQALIKSISERDKEKKRTLLIMMRAAQADGDVFEGILDTLE